MKLPYVITLLRRQLVLAFISRGQKSSLIHGKCGPLDELGTQRLRIKKANSIGLGLHITRPEV